MARARNIKPGFFKNEDLAECSVWARFIFPGLWMLADREGRMEDRPKRIKGELLPFDAQEVEPLLQELAARGFILRYQVEGRALIHITNFQKHQNPHHREAASVLAAPPDQSIKPEALGSSDGAKASDKPEESPGLCSQEATLHEVKTVLIPSSLIPDSLSSDSMTSEAGASAGKPADQMTESELWKAGIDMLTKAGMSEKQARPFLGKLAGDHGNPAAMEAISAAVVAQPVDPAAYIRAACRGKHAGQRPAVRHGNLENIDYRKGLHEDGSLVS